MTVSVGGDKKSVLLTCIAEFAQAGKQRPLRDFLSIAGHINWYLTVYPLLCPYLSGIYAKTAGKTQMMAPIRVNNTIRDELVWFSRRVALSDRIFLLKNIVWDPRLDVSNTLTCFTDACMGGMAYWFPQLRIGFQCRILAADTPPSIFYYEALVVTSGRGALRSLKSQAHGGWKSLVATIENID
jgi:hypothetical protein